MEEYRKDFLRSLELRALGELAKNGLTAIEVTGIENNNAPFIRLCGKESELIAAKRILRDYSHLLVLVPKE